MTLCKCACTCQLTTNAYIQGGLFGKLKSGLDQVGREITKGADWTADQINKSLSTTATGNILVKSRLVAIACKGSNSELCLKQKQKHPLCIYS